MVAEDHVNKIKETVETLRKSGHLDLFANGLGSSKPVLKLLRPPPIIQGLFRNASEFHDVGYACGGGIEEKEVVDLEFASQCFLVIRKLKFMKAMYAMMWLFLDDRFLLNFGVLSFSFRDEPIYSEALLVSELA